jgi:hypothetical protein
VNVSRFDPHPTSFELNGAHGATRYHAADRTAEETLAGNEAHLDASASALARKLAIYEAAFRVTNGAMRVLSPVD